MKRTGVLIALFLLALFLAAAGVPKRRGSGQATQGKPGVFDYYLLTLSWSPEFCHSHAEKPECQSGHHGFVVHGLWPQYVDGYPEHCSNAPGLTNPGDMTDIMPDEGLVAHEWSTHGTCSGLEAEDYFKLLRRLHVNHDPREVCGAARELFDRTPRCGERISSVELRPQRRGHDRQLRK